MGHHIVGGRGFHTWDFAKTNEAQWIFYFLGVHKGGISCHTWLDISMSGLFGQENNCSIDLYSIILGWLVYQMLPATASSQTCSDLGRGGQHLPTLAAASCPAGARSGRVTLR